MKNDELEKLMPKDIFDTSTIAKLLTLTEQELQIILPRLIRWYEDLNWPVTEELTPVMLKYPKLLVPLLIEAMDISEKDDVFKYFVVVALVKEIPCQFHPELIPSLRRLAESPTVDEQLEDLEEVAQDILQRWNAKSSKYWR